MCKRVFIFALLCTLLTTRASAVTVLLTEDYESPSSPTAYEQGTLPDNGNWVGATDGFNANYHGITDKAGGDFTDADPNHQAYAFRYSSNAGITSDENSIGLLITGVTYTVSFDVVEDGGRPDADDVDYNVYLIVFDPGEARISIASGGTILKQVTGSGTSDGSFSNVTFTFTADPVANADELLKDLGLRFRGSYSSAIIDNVNVEHDGTGDLFPPIITTKFPEDNADNATLDCDIVIDFNETIVKGSGNIVLKRSSDNSAIETIDVTSNIVTISGSRLTVERSVSLDNDEAYYMQLDAGIVEDSTGNPYQNGINDTTTWNFQTVLADEPTLVFSDSFESPVVGGRVFTDTEHWETRVSGSLGYWKLSGLINNDSGTFTTPYGDQAGCVWYFQSALTIKEASISETLVAEDRYVVTFRVAKASNMTGRYNVQLLAFDPGDPRVDNNSGTLLAYKNGTARWSDMSEMDSFTFTPDTSSPHLGKLLAIQIDGGLTDQDGNGNNSDGDGAIIDNIKLTYYRVPAGTVFYIQ